jgi:hypothetical protein
MLELLEDARRKIPLERLPLLRIDGLYRGRLLE